MIRHRLDLSSQRVIETFVAFWLGSTDLMPKLATLGFSADKAIELMTQMVIDKKLVIKILKQDEDGFLFDIEVTNEFQAKNPDLIEYIKTLHASKEN